MPSESKRYKSRENAFYQSQESGAASPPQRDSRFCDAAKLRHHSNHSRHHTKDEQRSVVSVIAYDSLPVHQRSHRYSPRSTSTFGPQKVLQYTLHEWIEVHIVGRSALARQKLMGTPVLSQLRSRRLLKTLPGKGGCLWCSVREDRQRQARNDHVSSREVKMSATEEP